MMFAEWITGIIGISALGILVDIIVKKGETEKYIRGVFGLFTLFVIVSPLPELLKMNVSFDELFDFSAQVSYVDEDFSRYVYDRKWLRKESQIQSMIEEKTELNSTVDIYFVESCPEKIDAVYVYLKKSGIWDEEKNKYIIEDVKSLVCKTLDVEDERVVIEWEKTIT